jgi:hypothetical protein
MIFALNLDNILFYIFAALSDFNNLSKLNSDNLRSSLFVRDFYIHEMFIYKYQNFFVLNCIWQKSIFDLLINNQTEQKYYFLSKAINRFICHLLFYYNVYSIFTSNDTVLLFSLRNTFFLFFMRWPSFGYLMSKASLFSFVMVK